MSLPVRAALLLAIVAILAGCAPTGSDVTATTEGSPKPTVSSTSAVDSPDPTATAAPQTITDFLVDGTPFVFDADGYWKGHYAFFTDDTKTVRCDIYIYSGDSGGVVCATTAGNQGLVTYDVPAAQCDQSMANPADGYSVAINFKVFDTGNSGFMGCGIGDFFASAPGDELPVPPVLHDNQKLTITTAVYVYTCTVAEGIASCADSYSGASITYGLSVAEFAG